MQTHAAVANLMQQGQIAHDQGRLSQARNAYKKALDLNPRNYDAAFLVAITYGQQDNVKMATNFFRRATEIDPQVAEGHFNLGYALQLLKDFHGAVQCYRTAIAVKPDYHVALHNLGVVNEELGQFETALDCLDKALALRPDAEESLYAYGSVLTKLGRNEEAIEKLSAAIKLAPAHAKALNNRGLAYMALQRYREAIDDFALAVAADPEDATYQFHKGLAASARKLHPLAEESFSAAIKLQPDHILAWHHRAFALEMLKRNEEALVAFERVRKLDPNMPYIDGHIHSSRLHMCEWSSYDQNVARILDGIDSGKPIIPPHGALLIPATRAQRRKAAESWATRQFGIIGERPFARDEERPDPRIKIAYVSADYHMHPVAMLTARMFELHDRDRFEVYAFSLGGASRVDMRLRIEAGVDHFINAREMTDIEIIEKARAEKIDVAIDMTGYTADGRPGIFALRAAPVQVNYLGFSGTMGAPFMDYIIGDPVLIPPEHDADYTEQVARLPDSYMPGDPTRAISDRPMTRADYNLPEDAFVFCGFNNPNKLCPPQFDIWMRILQAVPGSVLWLSPAPARTAENLRREAVRRGVDPARLVFAHREDLWADHLARHRLADLFLDTLPHNAHATAHDALWAGLPILTRLGEAYAGRVAGSLVQALGMGDMIAADAADYERMAIEIATTPGRAAALKQRLAERRLSAPLFDAERYTRKIETAFEVMTARARSGKPPQTFDIA